MKHITSLWLLVFLMTSTPLIAQNSGAVLKSKKAASAIYKTRQQPNLNVEVKTGKQLRNDPDNPMDVVPATLTLGDIAGIVVTPMLLEEIHTNPPQQTTKNLTIENMGDTPLDVNLTVDLGGRAPDTFTMVSLVGDKNPVSNCKSKNLTNLEPSLCVDNLYSSGCSFGDGLIAWNLANINVPNIPCTGTPAWYHDYRDMVHELAAGESYILTVQAGYSSTYFDVWIDFNDDLVLSADELVIDHAFCTDGNVPYTFDLSVPANAPGGEHVLRFRTNWITAVSDPCATYSYGNCCDFKANTSESTANDWLWIAEANLNFTLAPNEVKIVQVHFDSGSLPLGNMVGAIYVASNDPNTPLIEVVAMLLAYPPGELTVDPTELNEIHEYAPEITTQILNLSNNTDVPVSWSLAINYGMDVEISNRVPEVSAETPVYTGQIEVESEPGVIPHKMVTEPAPASYATYSSNRGELYNNGGFVTAAGVGSNGTNYSELQDASLGMSSYGSGGQISAGNSIADDFVVTDTWTIESFTFYAYQTGLGSTSTLNDVRVQIYDGDPSAGGTVIWGNLSTNLITSTYWTNAWRVLESSPAENRPIFRIIASTTGLILSPGTYWVEMSIGGTGFSGPWAPPVTVVGQTPTGNSIQKTSAGWAPLVDIGPQGLPFIITGTDEVVPWLSAAPVSGSLANGQTIPITVTFDSEGLESGIYYGNITISSNQPDIFVPVTFNVQEYPTFYPPTNLTAETYDFLNVKLTWDAPDFVNDPEWITYSGENTLAQIDPSFSFNWAIKGYIEAGMQVEGYNIYRKIGNQGSFNLIGSTNANTLTYLDQNLVNGLYYYHVKAQYAAGLSAPSNEVLATIYTNIDPSVASGTLQVYPNPANDHIIIKSEDELRLVTLTNYSGQVIVNQEIAGKELRINTEKFAKGVYMLQAETKDGRSVHKVIIQ
jgi:hypothetical protein